MNPRLQGKIKWFNSTKGFGYISREGGDDVFLRSTALVGQASRLLREGTRVEFTLERGPKGPQATQVRIIG